MYAVTARRREIIREVLDAYGDAAPAEFAAALKYIADITKVEVRKGDWRSGKGKVKVRLPATLFHCLRQAFNRYLPDEPPFGATEDDLRLLFSECPAINPKTHRS